MKNGIRGTALMAVIVALFTSNSANANEGFRIVPSPRKMEQGDRVAMPLGAPVRSNRASVAELFVADMDAVGHDIQQVSLGLSVRHPVWVWGGEEAVSLLRQLRPPEQKHGYTLLVGSEGAAVAAGDLNGLRYGVQSVLQLVEQSADGSWPAMSIRDWPHFGFRAFHSRLRPPKHFGAAGMDETIGIYKWMIRRLARYKYTHLCLMLKGDMVFKSRPELQTGPWTASDIQRLLQFAAARGITVFPEVKTLGKFFHGMPQAQLEAFSHLLEPKTYIGQLDYQARYHDGYRRKAEELEQEQKALEKERKSTAKISGDFKVRNPQVFTFLRPVLDEVYDAFGQPDYYHIGCDESFYTAIQASPQDRGKYMADYINRVARHLQAKGATVMMWDDMLVNHEQFPWFFEAHGGPPLNTWRAVDHLDRDLVLACWHYGWTVAGHRPEDYPMVPWLAEHGFEVIGVPWFNIQGMIDLARVVDEAGGSGMMGTSFGFAGAIQGARGKPLREAARRKVASRKELSVLAATAEVSWAPHSAAEALDRYDPESWEKRWLPFQPGEGPGPESTDREAPTSD